MSDGEIIDYYVQEAPDVVIIFALTPDDQLLLVRQYKHGIGEEVTELPAGYLQEDENPLTGARRELREETGYAGDDSLVKIATLIESPSRSNNRCHVFLARGVRRLGQQRLDRTEDIRILFVTPDHALDMVRSAEICDAKSVAAILLAWDILNYAARPQKPS